MNSIYDELKNQNRYDGDSGTEEINFLYFYASIPKRIKELLADELIKSIMDMKVNKNENTFLIINDFPLISYADVLMKKINALVKEEILSEIWIRNLIKKLIFEGIDEKAIQLGLILSEKYLSRKYLSDVIETFSKSGDYIFYLKNIICNLKGYNSFLFDLAKKSKGTIKIFAVFNIEVISSEIRRYLIEESYKDEVEENLLIDYIVSNIDISKYISESNISYKEVNNMGYIIQNYISYKGLEALDVKEELINNYIPLAINKGNDIYCLYSMLLIKSEIEKDDGFQLNKKRIIEDLEDSINTDKWKEIFIEAINNYNISADLIIEISIYYRYRLSFQELEGFLIKEPRNITIYEYLVENGAVDEKESLFYFFKGQFNLDKITKGAENILIENVDSSYIEDILFLFVVRGLKKLSKQGKEIAIKALNARLNDTRWQAITILEKYNDFTEDERNLIKIAEKNEPNEDIRYRISLLNKGGDLKKNFIKVEDVRVTPYIDDIYLSTINISGVKERNQYYLQNELEQSQLYYIMVYKEAEYDIQDVKVVSSGGYILGYISEGEKNIFRNLINGGKYLYCRLKEYDLTKSLVKVNIYLSLKDVVDYCQETLKLMSYPENENNQ